MSASLPLSTREFFLFLFFFHNEQKRGRRIRASLRSDPSRDPRVLFDGTLRRFQSISRRNSRGQKETRSSSTAIHDRPPDSVYIYTCTRVCVRILSFQIFAHQTLFSPSPPSASAGQDENLASRGRWRTEQRGKGRNCRWGRNCFRISVLGERIFFSREPAPPKTKVYAARAGVTEKVLEATEMFIVSYRRRQPRWIR